MTTPLDSRPAPSDVGATPDTRDMVVVHRVFRREFRLLPQLVRRTAAGDAATAARVADWADEIVAFLHHHHTNEDAVVWPLLHARAPIAAELVTAMERQHQLVAELVEPVPALADRWRTEPSVANREVLALALDAILVPLCEHLDLEERSVLPLIEQHLTADEYGQLGERGRAAIPNHRMAIVLGALLEEASDAERSMLLGELPLAARAMWHTIGTRQYTNEMRRLRGGR